MKFVIQIRMDEPEPKEFENEICNPNYVMYILTLLR